MKVECIKSKLRDAVAAAERVTGKNLTLPVLSTILCIAKGKTLTLRATNLDLGIEIELSTKVEKEGTVAVPGNILLNFLSNVQSDSVILEEKGGNVLITTKNSKTNIKSVPHDDFPTLPAISDGESFTIPVKKLTEGFKAVWYSASLSDIKPEIASVFVYSDAGHIVFVATDSFRLAEKRVQFDSKEKIPSLLVPFKNVVEFVRILEDVSGDTEVTYNNNQISVRVGGIYLISRLVDGVFPDYGQIIPKEFSTEAVVLKQDLMNSLKLTNLFADKLNQITFSVSPGKKLFVVNSKNFDVGDNTTELDGALEGDSIELNFNHKYIIDCFQSIPRDSVALKFAGVSRPLVIQGVGDKSFTYLVMPLNQ